MSVVPIALMSAVAVIAGVTTAVIVAPKMNSKTQTADVASASKEPVQNSPVTNNTSALQGGQAIALEQKLASIEAQLVQLQNQVAQIPKTANTPVKSSAKFPLFIPFGSYETNPSQPNNITTWQVLPTPTITLDPTTYTGYKNMQLQMNMLVFQGNGPAYARLIDTTTNTVISNTTVSTSNFFYSALTSGQFQLLPGSRTYGIQVLSPTGYQVQISDAKIQVNF